MTQRYKHNSIFSANFTDKFFFYDNTRRTEVFRNPRLPSLDIYKAEHRTGTSFTNDISIEFKIRPKFAVLLFKMDFTDHIDICCRDVCKISLGSAGHILK